MTSADIYHAINAVYVDIAGCYPADGEMKITRDAFRRAVIVRGVTTNLRKADELWRLLELVSVIRVPVSNPEAAVFKFPKASALLKSQESTVRLPDSVWGVLRWKTIWNASPARPSASRPAPRR